ncbi:hypothetical protein [Synechococcus sp. PCC 7335]|uniref:hypothetical protein n=1 Tax=Synechococcus sp. (strain ATCC 29403 / PCC 7335) TaxID=91464 RepID=UPI0012F92A05|nr:hypothetical protein [Synechococcus sp. PCC 7335]
MHKCALPFWENDGMVADWDDLGAVLPERAVLARPGSEDEGNGRSGAFPDDHFRISGLT